MVNQDFTSRSRGSDMRNAILLLCIVMATGCEKLVVPTGVNSANALTRYIDKENNVICYQAIYNASTSISCVKLEAKRL